MDAKGGEVERLHTIYFLSHMGGHSEHSRLISVLHLASNGVYLRGETHHVLYFNSILSVLTLALSLLVIRCCQMLFINVS
jgi:hypothetical protein